MAVSVVREDGQPSRHPWYRIPATVEIDSWRYPVQEWSVEGFSTAGIDGTMSLGDILPAKLIFRFDGFSTTVEVSAEVIRIDAEDSGIVCRFTDMTRQKAAVLRAVIDSYLLGEFVAMDDIIHIVRRDVAVDRADPQAPTSPQDSVQGIRGLLKRWLGLTLVCLLLVALVGLSAWAGFRRLYVAQSASAVVTAPLVVIRAPQPSFYTSTLPRELRSVGREQPLAYVELVGGGAATIDSPCDCLILTRHVLDGQFVSTGEPLITLLPQGSEVFVSAKVPVAAAKEVALGDRAFVRFPDRSVRLGVVTRVLYGEPLERSLSAPLSRTPSNAISYSEVIVTLDDTLDSALIGVATSVEISTYRGPGSSHRSVEAAPSQ